VTPATSRSAPATASRSNSGSSTATPAAPASPNAKARPCTAADFPNRLPNPSSTIWPTATASDRPDVWSASHRIPSSDWPAPPVNTPTTLTTSSWLFPPRTREVQFDEKHAFVAKKQKNCDPTDPDDDHKGDWWDHVAYDPEHRLVLAVVPGARTIESAEEIVAEVKDRLSEQPPALVTSDELPAYASALEAVYAEPVEAPATPTPGRPSLLPERQMPEGLVYATVHKEREKNRVVAVRRTLVLGDQEQLDEALKDSTCSRTINTSFVERQHATDRGQNARKSRRTYRFSKDWRVHEAMTYYTLYRYNFCWAVRTLRVRGEDGHWQRRTPAMAAGLADHVWSPKEWLSFPAIQST
jgi:IS1 family transposase